MPTLGYYTGGKWTSAMLDGRTLSQAATTGSDLYGQADPDGTPQAGWFDQMMVHAVSEWDNAAGIDKFQAVLSGAGFIPVVGFVFDAANAVIYASRGMGGEAVISAISAVPGFGDAIGGALKGVKLAAKVGKTAAAVEKTAAIGTRAGQVARAVATGVGESLAEQTARVWTGQQDSIHWEQTLGAAVSGGLLGHATVGVGRLKFVQASQSFARRTAVLGLGTGFAGAAGDAVTQLGAMAAGRQDGFDLTRSGLAFAGGALGGALGQAAYDKTCFAADTPLIARNEQGWRRADEIHADDYLASRDEHDPEAPVVWNRVEEVFVAQGEIWELEWQGRTIRTTAEHPFYVYQLGWTPARELQAGQLLATMDGRYLPLTALASTGKTETVYNFRIAEGHTYFVGKPEWDTSLWAHNTCKTKNLNSNDAVSEFGIYEIRVKGKLRKIGKADMARVTVESGQPTRLHQQVRKLEEIYGKANVAGRIVQKLGTTTTQIAKAAERSRLQNHYDRHGSIPYGNRRSFSPAK